MVFFSMFYETYSTASVPMSLALATVVGLVTNVAGLADWRQFGRTAANQAYTSVSTKTTK